MARLTVLQRIQALIEADFEDGYLSAECYEQALIEAEHTLSRPTDAELYEEKATDREILALILDLAINAVEQEHP